MPLNGYTTNLPGDVVLDTGVLYVASTARGASRGAPTFDPAFAVENVDFDGKHAPIKGLDRKFHGEPVIAGSLIEFAPAASGNQIGLLEPGSSEATTGVTPNTLTTVTPKAGGLLYASGDYLTDVRLLFERGIAAGAGIKQYVAIYFPFAVVRKWGPLQGANKGEATIQYEIAARKDMASGTTADAAYKIEYRESKP